VPELPLNGAGHLPQEAMYGYENRLLTASELRVVHDHVAVCGDCRARLAGRLRADEAAADLRASFGLEARRSAPIRWWAAAAALVAAVSGAVWWAGRRAAPVSFAAGTAEQARVRAALRTGRLPLAPFVKDLTPAPETLMGEAPARPPMRLSPAGTGVLDGAPRFSWGPVAGSAAYRVRVFSAAGEPVAESAELSRPEWIPDRPLPAGATYQWQVEASGGEEPVTIPEPPAATPRFRVLDPAAAARLRALVKARPREHLLLAVEYARAGAIDEARSELQEELAESPSREDVRRLLRALDESR
jgi:hypothetical protein